MVEDEKRNNEDVVETSRELVNKMEKRSRGPKESGPIPISPPPFPLILVKKNEDCNYKRFITILKQLSINVPLIETLEQMPSNHKLMKDMVTKKRWVGLEDDDQI